jgi:hypothetical protein
MARAALFSKFHFTRLFQRATGLSPGRFLSALRLERAKQLLVSTSLNVIDISHQVGYKLVPESGWEDDEKSTAISGRVLAASDPLGPVFVGRFRDPLPQGRPIRCTVLSRSGP